MKITFIKPNIGRLEHSLYVDEGRMEPLQLGVLAGLTPPDVECVLYDDRIEPIPYDEPTDLAAITVEIYTARRAYEIAEEYRLRGVPVVMGGFHATLAPDECRGTRTPSSWATPNVSGARWSRMRGGDVFSRSIARRRVSRSPAGCSRGATCSAARATCRHADAVQPRLPLQLRFLRHQRVLQSPPLRPPHARGAGRDPAPGPELHLFCG
jgi:hypothetical protein